MISGFMIERVEDKTNSVSKAVVNHNVCLNAEHKGLVRP